jgi:hypothetical protein
MKLIFRCVQIFEKNFFKKKSYDFPFTKSFVLNIRRELKIGSKQTKIGNISTIAVSRRAVCTCDYTN